MSDNLDCVVGPEECVIAEQSEESKEFERRLALPILERHASGYWISDTDKIDFLFNVAVKADKLMQEIGPQLIPMLESIQKNPMLKMFLK